MVITCVSITHLICSFSEARALMAQRYPSRLYAKLVVQFNGFKTQFFLILLISFMNKA